MPRGGCSSGALRVAGGTRPRPLYQRAGGDRTGAPRERGLSDETRALCDRTALPLLCANMNGKHAGKESPLERKVPPRRLPAQSLSEDRLGELRDRSVPWLTLPAFC